MLYFSGNATTAKKAKIERTANMIAGVVAKADPDNNNKWGSIKVTEPIREELKGKTIVFEQDQVTGSPCYSNDAIWFTMDDASATIVKALRVWHAEDVTDKSTRPTSEAASTSDCKSWNVTLVKEL